MITSKTIAMETDRHDNLIAFFAGALGSVSSLKVWILQIAPSQGAITFMEDWAFKLVGTCILGVVGGCLGLLGKDIYRFKVKPRLFKNNKEDK